MLWGPPCDWGLAGQGNPLRKEERSPRERRGRGKPSPGLGLPAEAAWFLQSQWRTGPGTARVLAPRWHQMGPSQAVMGTTESRISQLVLGQKIPCLIF